MQVKWPHYGKILLILLVVIGLFTLSIKPSIQDLSTIEATSKLTLQGQAQLKENDSEATTDTNSEEQQASTKEHTSLEQQEAISEEPAAEPTNTSSATSPAADNKPALVDGSNHVEMLDNAEVGDAYFTTNLHNNQIVTEPSYYLSITQLDSSLTVNETSVELNQQLLQGFTGALTVIEGENTVIVRSTYTDKNGLIKSAKQSYRIILNTKTIVIDTTAQNEEVVEDVYRFTAKSMLNGDTLPLVVTLNDKPIHAQAGYSYAVTLQPGENDLVLSATDGTNNKQVHYQIHYQQHQANLTFETDLSDQKVSSPAFHFTANALYNDEAVPFSASLNGVMLPAGTNFDVELASGTNTIHLQASYKGEQRSKQFKILYSDPTIAHTKPTDELAPKLKTDLTSGTHVKGLIKTINVWPTTADGSRIRGKNVAVKVNGVGVPFVWDDTEKTSYKLALQHGDNQVEIRAWDDEGRIVKETFSVTAEDLTNGVIGQATISVEASVLGIPYLIPPTKMDIHQGEKGSYLIDQLLRQHGFSYNHTGTLETNFYLSALKKPNMLANVAIADDLWQLVEASSTRAFRDDYSTDSLGEFDFANGSGWMFSVNGDYPNYGFSDAYFLDGDVVRIRFTLHYGRDIKGFGSTGGNSGSNWDKEW